MNRAHRRGRGILASGALLACVLIASERYAFALDPTLDISQYAHTVVGKIREGFTQGVISAIAQTPDGYLWLGTEFGLLRFDGVRTVLWQPPPDQPLPSSQIFSLLAARDGTLWIGTAKGLASLKEGRVTPYAELAGQAISKVLEDHEGSVWVGAAFGGPGGRVCVIQKASIHCYGEDGSLGIGVFNLYEDHKGNLWVGVKTGLWRWKPGPPKFYPLPGEPDGIQGLAEDADGSLLVSMGGGIRRFTDGRPEMAYPFPGTLRQFHANKMLRDRDGGLWIGTTAAGLVRVHQGKADVFAQSDGLSADHVTTLFEDREGNIWVATLNGLDRFREFAVTTFSVNQGLSNNAVGSVLAATDGSVWLATDGGLNRWNNGEITVPRTGSDQPNGKLNGVPPLSLFQDGRKRIWVGTVAGVGYLENDRFISVDGAPGVLNSFTEDAAGNLWIANLELGLLRVVSGRVVQQIPTARLGHEDPISAIFADRLRGGLWLGFSQGGIAYFADGRVRASYAAVDGLGVGHVTGFLLEQDGTLWAATEGGLSRLKNGRAATLTGRSGLPCDNVHSLIEDDDHSFWLSMPCGLVRIARPELDAWAAAVDKDQDAKRTIQVTVFDSSDGVRSRASTSGYRPLVARSSDGKLWFTSFDGAAVVDPHRLSFNKVQPPVHIEQIIADRKTYDAASAAKGLPPLIRDLDIDYTALSFVAPEKVRFRYKLEGYDDDWQDAGTRRQAFYTNLAPRNYRFRVIASNNSGVWNEAGAFLDFTISPAYYQTTWFRLSVVAAFLALLAGLYQLRLRQLARQYNLRMEERTRIAQDLHDTLLQGFLSASMQLHLVIDHMPAESPMRETLSRVQQLMTRVINEGRSAVRGLRASDPDMHDLAQAFSRAQKEIATGEQVNFRIIVEGRQRPLHPLIRDEVYRIGREAIVNAFRHAQAQHIEVEIDYAPGRLRVLVRDDGCGIDPSIASSGRAGHWGLSGMRERAERIGGRINVASRKTGGTEVDLLVPGKLAFQMKPSRSRLWLARLIGKAPEGVQKTPRKDGQ